MTSLPQSVHLYPAVASYYAINLYLKESLCDIQHHLERTQNDKWISHYSPIVRYTTCDAQERVQKAVIMVPCYSGPTLSSLWLTSSVTFPCHQLIKILGAWHHEFCRLAIVPWFCETLEYWIIFTWMLFFV